MSILTQKEVKEVSERYSRRRSRTNEVSLTGSAIITNTTNTRAGHTTNGFGNYRETVIFSNYTEPMIFGNYGETADSVGLRLDRQVITRPTDLKIVFESSSEVKVRLDKNRMTIEVVIIEECGEDDNNYREILEIDLKKQVIKLKDFRYKFELPSLKPIGKREKHSPTSLMEVD